jgi:uncharacterized protein YkwD
MNWIDILLIAVVLLSVWSGWQRGFISSTLGLGCWMGSAITGYLFYPRMADFLSRWIKPSPWLLPIAFISTTILAGIVLGICAGYIRRSVPQNITYSPINKFLGIIPGAVNGWVGAVILSALLFSLPLQDSITNAVRSSRFAPGLAMRSEWADRKLAPVFDPAIRQTLNSLTVRSDTAEHSGETVHLPYTENNARVSPSLEEQMIALVNEERQKQGLKPLKADPELTAIARAHSKDMFEKGYFSHISLDGKDPFERMREAHISFFNAGENLALAQTLPMAHSNLMHSPGHRANILSPAFGRIGIGILDGGYYGLMISQEFRN